MKNYLSAILIICTFGFATFSISCYKSPIDIAYNIDVCSECGMLISDQRFGAEILLRDGNCLKYDTIDCLVKTILDDDVKVKRMNSRWVIDYSKPGQFIYLPNAIFYQGNTVKSPSGYNILAVEDQVVLERIKSKHGGKVLSFKDVVKIVEENQLAVSL